MPNLTIVNIYIPFALITAIVLLEVFLRSIKHKGNYMFMVLCLLVICWYASDIAGALTKSEGTSKFLWNFILIFVGFIPPVLLVFVLDFYRINTDLIKKYIPLIFIIPSVNTIIALTSKYHSLMYARLDIISLSPIHEVVRVWGPWFWVHTVYCYIMSMAIISVILLKHFHMPKFYRIPSTLMAIGIALTLVGNVITLLKLLPATLDPTLIGTSLALIFFNFAIINNDNSKFVRYSFKKVFDYLDLFVLVMDECSRIVHINRPAVEWLSSLGITVRSLCFNDVMGALINKGVIQKDLGNEEGTDIYFPADPFPVVMNLYVQNMVDANGDTIGSVAIFTDVTQNRMLLERLEAKAGMDSLTGIPNRMAYEGARRRLDAIEHLPLSVIMCDVNGLKAVNDNLGHKYGDMMLQVVAEVLESVCKKSQFLARIGGDEFIFLLSRTPYGAATAFRENVREALSSRDNLPFTLSAALGAATKHSIEEDLTDIINLADSRMYENKRFIKSRQQ